MKNRTGSTILLAVLCAALALPGMALAQADIHVGTNFLVDDNIFRNYYGQSDMVSIPYASLGWQIAPEESSNQVYLGYSGQFFLFNELSHRDFSVHEFGLDYNYLFPNSRNRLALGGNVETRLNPAEYSYYNYTSLGLYVNWKTYLRDDLMLLAGYNLSGRQFSEFREFNYVENVFALQTSWFLPTRTTLQLSGALYYKNYTTGIQSLDSVYITSEQIEKRLEQVRQRMGQMRGRGMGGWMVTPGSAGTDIVVPDGAYWYTVRQDEFPSTEQVKLGLTVAQSLAKGTGLSLSYTARINPQSRNRYLSGLGESVLNNEELFDDHYSYNGHEGRIQLRQVLPWHSDLTGALTLRRRHYSGRPALDAAGEVLPGGESRLDRAALFELDLSKSLPDNGKNIFSGMTFSLSLGTGRNRSNDAYYHYSSTYAMFALEKTF